MTRIFITHIVPRDDAVQHNLSVAACNFSWNLIEGGAFDKFYSVLPTFVGSGVEQFDGLVCSRLRRWGVTRRLAPIAENIKLFRRIPRGASVWYYNCTQLNMLLIVLLRLFKPSVKQQMIILDYTPTRKLMERFFLWLANHMDGTIRLADSPLFTVKNTACLPGVVPMNGKGYPRVERVEKSFLISGALGDNIAMLPMLLEAFSQMPELTLHITGKAPDESLITRYTKQQKNIVYHGMVAYEEYLRILHATPFLLSTRNPDYPENQCNFPSKIIEALLHNRIIVSTLHYPQLNGVRYFEVPADGAGFANALCDIAKLPDEQLLTYANQSQLVTSLFNTNVWRDTIARIEENSTRK